MPASRPAGPEAPASTCYASPLGPADQRTLETTTKTNNNVFSRGRNLRMTKIYPIEISREFVQRLWIRAMETVSIGVTTGVSIGVSVGVSIGTAGVEPQNSLLQAPRNFRMRASTSARGMPS